MRIPLASRLGVLGRAVLGTALVLVLAAVAGWMTRGSWAPPLKARIVAWAGASDGGEDAHHHDHADANSLEVSEAGLQNIGFRPWTVALGPFAETVTMPAMVVERPGRSQLQITAPLTGTITRIHPIEGVAVEPGNPLFEIRLTHEEVVVAQRDFLRTAESLDVVNREIARLRAANAGDESVIAGKRVIEQEYEKQKLEASLRADRQALYLHGLSESQVNNILKNRKLLAVYTVGAPEHVHDDEDCPDEHSFHVQKMLVKPGDNVHAGQGLCLLADHCELFLEGRAFEGDAARLRMAAQQGWEMTAIPLSSEHTRGDQAAPAGGDGAPKEARPADALHGLKLLYVADRVDAETRAFLFYLRLRNQVMRPRMDVQEKQPGEKSARARGQHFIDWRFKPGQRFDLRVPVRQWEECIKLPIDAVVDEGIESYVFVQNGKKFQRVPVHVQYRDRQWAVIPKQNGALFAGDVLAARGAYQLHLALKNKAGGGVDPHAGHNH